MGENETSSSVQEMNIQEVKDFIAKEFQLEIAEKFEAQKIDGKSLLLLSKKATREQYEACGLMTVADQLKLTMLVNASADIDEASSCVITAVKAKKPSKAQLNQISDINRRIYKTKRKAIRAAAIKRWPGNNIPKFKTNKTAVAELNQLVEELVAECSFPPLNFGRDGIKQHILDVLNERRRHQRNGHDYSKADKRTLKRKTPSSERTSTAENNSSASPSSDSLSDSIEDESGDTEIVEESEEEKTGHCLQVKDSQTVIVDSSSVEKSCASESGNTDEVMESEPDAEEAFPDDTAKLIICVAYNAIRLADVQRNQLASSAKAMGIKNAPTEKNGLVKVVAEALVKKNYVRIRGNPKNASRRDIQKLKPF